MKRAIACISLAAVLALYGSAFAVPNDEYDDSESHPLRTAAYILNPVGVGLEYIFYRPLHWLVSRNETTELIFGHRPHGAEEMEYLQCAPWQPFNCPVPPESNITPRSGASTSSMSGSTSMSTSARPY